MRRLVLLFVVLAACGGTSAPAPVPAAPEPQPAPAPSAEATRGAGQLDPYLASYRSFSGYVHVVRGGEVLYSRGLGYADRERETPNTADTSFRIGSVTKQFTAAAIMLLVQRGALSVDDPVRKHLPEYPAPAGDRITIHHLLTHTSGIPNLTDDPAFMAKRDRPHTTAELIAEFADEPLEFEPGARFEYSNSGYIVLGAILERVSGRSYAELMRAEVFEPAGLRDTVVGDAEGARDRATGYELGPDDELAPAAKIDMSVPHAAGAIRSTANDLVRWHEVLARRELLTAETLAVMHSPTAVSAKDGEGYGYGWAVRTGGADDPAIYEHGGGIDGFTSFYLRIPAHDLVIVAWANAPGAPAGRVAHAALDVVLGGTVEPLPERADVAVSADALARLTGTYALTAASREEAIAAGVPEDAVATFATMEVRAAGGSVAIEPAGQPPVQLVAVDERTFVYDSAGIRVEFSFGDDGASPQATAMVVTQGGLRLTFERQ